MIARRYTVLALVLFVVLSVTDFAQTAKLIEITRGRITEGNPFAQRWLKQYDWHGLLFYKAATVVIVISCVAILARHRPLVGAGVITFGCLVLLVVTFHSHQLLANPPPPLMPGDQIAG